MTPEDGPSPLFFWMLAVVVRVRHDSGQESCFLYKKKKNMDSFYNLLTERTTYKAFLLLSQVDQN